MARRIHNDKIIPSNTIYFRSLKKTQPKNKLWLKNLDKKIDDYIYKVKGTKYVFKYDSCIANVKKYKKKQVFVIGPLT